ncbi:PKS-NRPS hybrid synthetase CHGG_01239-like [Camellia sinensis]|uniref:PKS-NRPS hybrid synthetase CHGG_01239-like n=1 Tax=Camellia sinensis TaxID=4442 RepID=UPI0010355865|nr:PKS-NRPS hybrid synthetase CHGG_01239-like [Camellia sinensis]
MIVTDLFWAQPVSLDLLRSFPKVLIIDCTYKTNRYRLPLLEIVGVTSTDMSFFVAFAYLQFERIDNYVWVLTTLRSLLDGISIPEVIVTDRELALMNAIDRVFSTSRHLLCRWHISRNVLAKCKKMFKSKEEWDKFISLWNFLVLSSTELEYNEHLARLLTDFDTYPEAVQYVSQSWLIPYFTTNRAESAHAKLKRQLGSNQINFECSWTKIHSLFELQHVDIKASFEKSLTIVQHQFKPSHFRELRGNISITALDHVLAESKRANDVGIDALVCGCVVRRTHGLPCTHEIADYIRQGRPIPLDSINPHWRTLELEILHKLGEIADPQSSFLIEPDVKPNPRGKGHKKIDVSTYRDPCAFELVQSGHDSHSPMGTQIPTQDSVKVHKKRPAKEQPYIRLIEDVDADGNCGFRAIAGLMGLTKAEWVQVRRDLLQELHTHIDHYTHLYGSHDRIKELTHILSYFEPNPGYHRWMIMPDMGHLIASCYNVVFMLRGHPVPPIATNWCKFRHFCAAGYDTAYSRRIEHFKEVIHSGVATRETFDCINLDE